jgi:glycosidase
MKRILPIALILWLASIAGLRGEALLQYSNTTWREITEKIPEIAEAGYESLWLPPPAKAGGGYSVGYDVFDRFDLGSVDQRGSVSTRYGTEGELLNLIRVAHRFGMRVYLDSITNHNGFDTPLFELTTPEDIYPGFVAADFHLRVQEDGTRRKWGNVRDWSDEWQVQNLGLSGLLDIAQEPGTTNLNYGEMEGDTAPKPLIVRHPDH